VKVGASAIAANAGGVDVVVELLFDELVEDDGLVVTVGVFVV
jgi:hypothetical protein